jgi:hypothetical protein
MRLHTLAPGLGLVLALALGAGCDEGGDEVTVTTRGGGRAPALEGGDAAGGGGGGGGGGRLPAGHPGVAGSLRFDKTPEGWVSVPPANAMRLAEWRIPKVEGDAEDGTVTLSRAGGGVEANVDRWRDQFEGKPEARLARAKLPADGSPVTYVEIEGRFIAPVVPGAPERVNKPGFTLLGAIIEAPEGAYFIKATGPAKTMAANREALRRLVESAAR